MMVFPLLMYLVASKLMPVPVAEMKQQLKSIYTQSQKKRTVKSWVSFAEECR